METIGTGTRLSTGGIFRGDHCVYDIIDACVIQATVSLTAHAPQPQYICPTDLPKLLRVRATRIDEMERYKALLVFCGQIEE